jgi:signal transduction histidine kinase
MRDQAAAVADHLALQPDGRITLDLPSDLRGLYSQPYGRYAYAVIDDRRVVLFSSLGRGEALFAADPGTADVEFLSARRGKATLSGASVRRNVGGEALRIQAGEDLANRDVLIDDIASDFFRNVGWITLPILMILLVTDIAIFRRALRPLREASDTAKSIGPARTDVRLPTEGIPREVQPLVLAVNQGLDRLEEGFRIQRDFTADAAHELRTPLTILRTRLEGLQDETGRALRSDVDGMARIISQLLDMAELDSVVIDPAARADLRQVAADVIGFVAPLALAKRREIALTGVEAAVWVRGNAEMIGRAIRNLVDNAIKHAPAGTTVEIVVASDGSIAICDEGPGVSAEERELIFHRFWRRDRRSAGSSGLGLSIVRRIAELHGAEITVGNRSPCGAKFTLHFGLADPLQADLEPFAARAVALATACVQPKEGSGV